MRRLRAIAAYHKKQLRVYREVAVHPRTPRLAKWCLAAAIAYAVMPLDLIPDFIPLVGHFDDVIIIPALLGFAIWLVPTDVLTDCRKSADASGT